MQSTTILRLTTLALVAGAAAFALSMISPWRTSGEATAASSRDAAREVDAVLNTIASDADPAVAASSNPFVVAANTPELDRIVALGTPGITASLERIERSKNSGLEEYLLAICMTRIAKADLDSAPGRPAYWESGKQFPEAWRAHLKVIPAEVRRITKSDLSEEEKNRRLERLGTPAIPYILDEIERGNSGVSLAAEHLMNGTVELGGEPTRGLARASWARDNRERFSALRAMVEEASR